MLQGIMPCQNNKHIYIFIYTKKCLYLLIHINFNFLECFVIKKLPILIKNYLARIFYESRVRYLFCSPVLHDHVLSQCHSIYCFLLEQITVEIIGMVPNDLDYGFFLKCIYNFLRTFKIRKKSFIQKIYIN